MTQMCSDQPNNLVIAHLTKSINSSNESLVMIWLYQHESDHALQNNTDLIQNKIHVKWNLPMFVSFSF